MPSRDLSGCEDIRGETDSLALVMQETKKSRSRRREGKLARSFNPPGLNQLLVNITGTGKQLGYRQARPNDRRILIYQMPCLITYLAVGEVHIYTGGSTSFIKPFFRRVCKPEWS